MAVTSVKEFGFGEGRGADIGGIDDSTATRLFRVHVDSAQDSFDTVLQTGLLPTIFSVHPDAPGMTARRLRPSHAHKLVWVVTVEYPSAPISKEKIDRELQPIPTARGAKIEWITNERLVVASKDANGKPYVTSAGEEYDAEDRQRPGYRPGRRRAEERRRPASVDPACSTTSETRPSSQCEACRSRRRPCS